MPTSPNSVSCNTLFNNIDEAINYLNSRTNWSIGMLCTVLYLNTNNNQNDVEVLVAIGIKNTAECGPTGQIDSDKWKNKYYPQGDYGPEFYKIMFDSNNSSDSSSSDVTNSIDLYTTTINMGGSSYDVSNEDRDQEVSDPLTFLNLNTNE